MAGVTLMDRERNEVVRSRTGAEIELAKKVDNRVLGWFGHMERMDERRLTKRVWCAEMSGKNARGRPRYGWTDGVNRAVHERSLTMDQARTSAMDRAEWKRIVRN